MQLTYEMQKSRTDPLSSFRKALFGRGSDSSHPVLCLGAQNCFSSDGVLRTLSDVLRHYVQCNPTPLD